MIKKCLTQLLIRNNWVERGEGVAVATSRGMGAHRGCECTKEFEADMSSAEMRSRSYGYFRQKPDKTCAIVSSNQTPARHSLHPRLPGHPGGATPA